MKQSFIRDPKLASRRIAMATFVRGPMHTNVRSPEMVILVLLYYKIKVGIYVRLYKKFNIL